MKNSAELQSIRTYLLFFFVLPLSLLIACGHPATTDECREILRRTAELELGDRLSDPQLIKNELQSIEKSMQEPMMKKCVGKRITKDAMQCIRQAKTSAELSHDCFR